MYLVIEQYNETMDISASNKFKSKNRAKKHCENAGYEDYYEIGDGIIRGDQDYNTCFIIPLRKIGTIM